MMADVTVRYAGAARYVPELARRLERFGAEVRWDPPVVPAWDASGQTHVEVELVARGDAIAVARGVSRFREFYPKGRVMVRAG